MNALARLQRLESLVAVLPPPREAMQSAGGGMYVAPDGRVFMEWGEMMRETEMLPPDDKSERWSEITNMEWKMWGMERPTWKATA